MSKNEAQVTVKKVSPYPISSLMEKQEGGEKLRAKIIRLTPRGVIADLGGAILQVSSFWKINFTLPVLNHEILTLLRVIRFFDRAKLDKGQLHSLAGAEKQKISVERLVEAHFIELDETQRNQIESFCRAIRQVEK